MLLVLSRRPPACCNGPVDEVHHLLRVDVCGVLARVDAQRVLDRRCVAIVATPPIESLVTVLGGVGARSSILGDAFDCDAGRTLALHETPSRGTRACGTDKRKNTRRFREAASIDEYKVPSPEKVHGQSHHHRVNQRFSMSENVGGCKITCLSSSLLTRAMRGYLGEQAFTTLLRRYDFPVPGSPRKITRHPARRFVSESECESECDSEPECGSECECETEPTPLASLPLHDRVLCATSLGMCE
eukprot:CAMPEP_0167801942 /NCGR_PEP_ID=MMETSP0111_2-20121227/18782_1 /TAXON_ID=91324 /ORGANISM="Lotharella globosa, Strain CCCM811" /LENGTH=243 /DNA_ID=CAMNT_0007697799 /DNA_START=90 /DNA_END=822 /DNA_ORIENTATION=-